MPKQITRYKCDFCKKTYSSKYPTIKHEGKCLYNPENKSCGSCGWVINDWCMKFQQHIFIKGQTIKQCPNWTEPEYEEDEEVDLDL